MLSLLHDASPNMAASNAVMMAFLFIVFALMIFRLRSYKKRHEKALGKARKSGAEGESLKLLSESGAIIAEFDVVEIRHDLVARLRCSINGTQESSSKLDFALAALSFLFHKSVGRLIEKADLNVSNCTRLITFSFGLTPFCANGTGAGVVGEMADANEFAVVLVETFLDAVEEVGLAKFKETTNDV